MNTPILMLRYSQRGQTKPFMKSHLIILMYLCDLTNHSQELQFSKFYSYTDFFKLSWFWEVSNGNAYVIINGLGPIATYQHNFEDEVEVEGCLSKGLSLVNQLPIHTSLYLETSWLLHQLALPIERNGLSVILP